MLNYYISTFLALTWPVLMLGMELPLSKPIPASPKVSSSEASQHEAQEALKKAIAFGNLEAAQALLKAGARRELVIAIFLSKPIV